MWYVHIEICSLFDAHSLVLELGGHSEEKDVLVKEVSHMGYGGNAVGGIQTVVSARNASLPLPVLLKSPLPCLLPAVAKFLRNRRILA